MADLNKKNIEDIDVSGKRVLVRCDFNVPLDGQLITNDERILGALPTIKYLIKENAKIILCSHLGRPDGFDKKYSLAPVAKRLSKLLDKEVVMAADVVGEDAREKAKNLKDGEILLLENTRYEKGETKNDPELAKKLASLAEIFVNDAFGTAHRAHASNVGVSALLPAVSGYLIEKEINYMGKALEDPKRPFIAILGGAKVSDKIGVIENLIEKVDKLIIGGGMAYTFFLAKGYEIGTSIKEEDKVGLAKSLIEKAKAKGVELLLPVDTVISKDFSADSEYKTVASDEIPKDWMGMDIGNKSIEAFKEAISTAKTIVWNGPMGVFEFDNFAKGTLEVATAVADASEKNGAISIVGGGDSVAAVTKLGFFDKMSHISTGGGAALEFLEGKTLPGIAALNDK